MAIANDWFVDYQNQLVVHATNELPYDGLTAAFNIGATVTNGTATAIIVNNVKYLPYDTQTGDFTVGLTVTGGSSGATGIIVSDDNTNPTGTLGLISVTGTFSDSEALTDTSTGAAQTNIPSGITTGHLDIVYVNGTFANNDSLSDDGPTPGAADANIPAASDYVTKTTVYTARQLYSFVQDTFDELGQMDDTVPMSAQTPTEFTMINGWYIDDESTKYLSGGAISSSGYAGEVRLLTFGATYTNAIITDIGKTVTQTVAGPTTYNGTLLNYDNTHKKWWVRMATSADIFDSTTDTVSLAGGTGTGLLSKASTSDEELYANIYTLGTIATDPNPKTYVFQNSESLNEWWGRGDAEAHIDVLIKVKEEGTFIDSGTITVFVRQFGDLYDHFPITLTSGGRNAVPLATSTDLNNNATGEITLSYSGSSGTWTVGQFVRDVNTGAYGEILADSGSALTVGNVILGGGGDFSAAAGALQESSDGLLDDGDATADLDTVTSVVRGYNDINILFSNITIDFTSGSSEPALGERIYQATGTLNTDPVAFYLGSTLSGGTWTGGDAAGTMYLANWDSVAFTAGAALNADSVGADFATAANPTNQAYSNSVDKAFEQGTAYPYNVIVDCAGRTMAQVYEWFKYVTRENANSTQLPDPPSDYPRYSTMFRVSGSSIIEEDGEEYIAAQSSYSPVKASPLGTLAGGKLFGARGVWVENMATADRQNFQLIDSNNNTRTPPNFITITVASVISNDKVSVFRTISGTDINKSQFTSDNSSNTVGSSSFTVQGSIPSDTPNAGYIRVVDTSDTSILRESRYAYQSWTGSTFTLSGSTTLDRTYSGGDTAYVPYFDELAGNTSVSVTVIYSADQTVLTRVRRYNGAGDSILPFQIAGEVKSTGYTVAAIRTSDSIVT